MVGTVPVPGDLSMEVLAATLTKNEQDFTQLTALAVDPTPGVKGNRATFVAQENELGALSICASGTSSTGTLVFSAVTVYVGGALTKIDVYRLPIA